MRHDVKLQSANGEIDRSIGTNKRNRGVNSKGKRENTDKPHMRLGKGRDASRDVTADPAQNDKRNTHDECQAQSTWNNDAPAIEKRHDTERIDRSNVCNRIPDHINNQRGKSDEHPCKNGCHAKTKLPDIFARLGHTLNAVGHTLTLIDSIVIRTVYRTTIWIACGKPRQCA